MNTTDFNEVQRFKTWWAWVAAAALNVLFIYAIVQQVILGKPFGTKPAPDVVLIITEIFFLLLLFFLMSIKLKTRINDAGIYYRFYPFQFKETKIEWHELRDAYMREYNSYHEYGGWGIRTGTKKTGKAINTSASSNKGLQLQFNDGGLLLIGTARPAEMQLIIAAVIEAGKINRGV
jgi:Na+/melibiose symporter-like transporter